MTPATPILRVPKRHFNALDLSRLIAAVAVLFWHYLHFTFPRGGTRAPPNYIDYEPLHAVFAVFYDRGYLAVEYFWTVSGFVFAHVYFANAGARQRFWIARIARLWPLHLLTLVVVALLQVAFRNHDGVDLSYGPNDTWHFVLNVFFVHYWGFRNMMTFNGPSWSLSVEILAYAAFWALLPLLRRRPLTIALGMMFVAAVPAWLDPEWKVATCLAHFFCGTAAYALLARTWQRPGLVLAGALGLLALAALDWRYELPYPQFPLWVVGLFGLVVWIDRIDLADRFAFGKRLGDASYGTYLWHFPIQLVMILALDALPGGRTLSQHWVALAIYIAAAVGAGFASHRWIERPAQRAVFAIAARVAPRKLAVA